MGKPSGFIEWDRRDAEKRDREERVSDSRELVLPLAPAEATQQAGRCIDCGVPFCHQGCPLGNLIPDFNDHVWHGRWREAHEVLATTNDFPELTGRLCPAPCEAACVLSIEPSVLATGGAALTGRGQAVTIEALEKTIIERAFAEGWVVPRPPRHRSGRRVAIVGSGPAGLACAIQLNRAGHEVTVFERDEHVGGLLRYGIPDFKLDKAVLDRRLALLVEEGVRFVTGADVGQRPRWDALRQDHDAVVLAIGAGRARSLEVPGAELGGVLPAMSYLSAQNRAIAGGEPSPLSAAGKRVVILGGGDTGSDCLGTAQRQGALEVTQVELLPAAPLERGPRNPWPRWPIIFRTSSSQEEGGARLFGRRTTRLEGQDGRLVAMHWVEVELKDGALRDVPGTEQRHPVDLLLLSMGFVGPEAAPLVEQLGVALDARGLVRIDAQRRTSVPGVYCAGDASRGASLIVWALSDGREVARSVDEDLVGRTTLATRGIDAPFDGR